MRDFVRKPANWFVVMIVVAFLAALIWSFFSSTGTNLPSYVPNTFAEPTASVEPTQQEPTIDTIVYSSENYGFSMPVPADWTYVVKDGYDTYINSQDGAKIVFVVGDYDVTLNNVTQEMMSAEVSDAGGLLGAFAKQANNTYAAIYEIGTLDYFELTTWDLDMMVRVSVQIPAERYNDYHDNVLALLDGFQWTPANPIPDGYSMYYSEYGNFEFPIPNGWGYEIVDGAFVAMDSETGANFRVSLTGGTSDLSGISQIDYINTMSPGKTSYMLSTYQNTGTVITAEASYISNGVEYLEMHDIMSHNAFQYEFLFQTPKSSENTVMPQFLTIAKYFRVF